MSMAPTGFCDLPTEALDDIARRAGPLDNVACSAICRAWRRALKTTRLRVLERPKLPHHVYVDPRCECPTWRPTMLPCDSRGTGRCYFARERSSARFPTGTQERLWIERFNARPQRSVTGTKKVCLCARESDRPVGVALDSKTDSVYPTRIIGSSYGWVVTVDRACSLALLEPLTGRRLPLPPVTSNEQVIKNVDQMGQSTFHKAALAPGRRLGAYAVMLIHSGGHDLSFLAPGAQGWTALHAPAWASRTNYQDVAFHKGAFYTVSVDSELNVWVPDGSSAGLRARLVASPRTEPVWAALVESTTRDELLMVSTPKDDGGGPSSWSQLDVSRYDEHEGSWIPNVNCGDMEILVKDNVGLCVPRRGEPPVSTSSWFYSVDYDSSDSTSYGPYDCSLWRYGSWFLPYVAPEFYHY